MQRGLHRWRGGRAPGLALLLIFGGAWLACSVTRLPPGDYLIAALTDLEPQDIYDPAFLKALEPSALKITVTKGEKTVQDIVIR